jgi:CRP-like cAMP-binding protein
MRKIEDGLSIDQAPSRPGKPGSGMNRRGRVASWLPAPSVTSVRPFAKKLNHNRPVNYDIYQAFTYRSLLRRRNGRYRVTVCQDRRALLYSMRGECKIVSDQHHKLLVEKFERHGVLSKAAGIALLQIPVTLRTFESAAYIVREADKPKLCAVLVSGFAYRQKVTGSGARQIIAVCVPGDIIDLQNLYLDVADHSVQMLTEGEVLVFPREALQRVAENEASIARAILLEVSLEASIFREWIVNIGRRNAKTKIAHLLCEFAMRLEGASRLADSDYELPMNQEHLGDALGLTAVHVNRMLRILADEGLVVWTRRSVKMPDWRRLRVAGDFNSRYLHLDQLRR